MPSLHDALGGRIGPPVQGIIVGKTGLVSRDSAELVVESLNDIHRIYDLPNLGRIFIEGTQIFPYLPIIFPDLDARGILLL